MNAFEKLPGVWQLEDGMGVCMTLLCGSERALLADTGYGLSDVRSLVNALTSQPLTVILTHAHHDHVLGARCFERTHLFEADLPAFSVYTSTAQRSKVASQAQANGIAVPDDFFSYIPDPVPLAEETIDLGGISAQIIHCPGHTPGSAVIFVPERELLLTGDNWNPCTWLFFPEALGAQDYRRSLQQLLLLPFKHVLCSHQPHLYDRSMLESFLSGLSDECLLSARKVDMGWPIDTREASPCENQIFVFDFAKTHLKESNP